MDEFDQVVTRQRGHVEQVRDEAVRRHRLASLPPLREYPLPGFCARVADALSQRWGQGRLEPQFDLIDREQHGGDVALKFPQLLRDGGPKGFAAKHQPWIVEVLTGEEFAGEIASVDAVGMYVNLRMSDAWLLAGADAALGHGGAFGTSDALGERTVVVDYSSPNVAKDLHAGHIRSTIVGHVLCNLYEACGALVHRVNHVNDFGGFGYSLEGWRRFASAFDEAATGNERLLEIYRIRRTMERALARVGGIEDLTPEEAQLVARYFPGADDLESLRAAMAEFTAAADARFAALEAGDADEVALWSTMVGYSLEAFGGFYDALGIHFDLVIGESFYARAGRAVVTEALHAGTARIFGADDVAAEVEGLRRRREADEISERELEALTRAATKDEGATVVPLENGERMVVLRRDGGSIYATRDLGAIALRRELFDPTDVVYVVGQEQQVHFDRLFRASRAIGIADDGLALRHLWFGFYVDAATGRKLSSRDSAANVMTLLSRSFEHFRDGLSERIGDDPATVRQTAQQLAVGSLVFNDLSKDLRAAVEIDAANVEATIAGFERSGGAYVVYAAVRAGNILRRAEGLPVREGADARPLDDQEVRLLLRCQQLPEVTVAAAREAEPAGLVRYLKDVATLYSSYYARVPVISDGAVAAAPLAITRLVAATLTNGLRFCHVERPAAM